MITRDALRRGDVARSFAIVALAVLAGCTQLQKPTRSCASSDDCLPPLVCCTRGYYLTLNDLTEPTCGPRYECPGDFLPFLPEGAPCGRAPLVPGETCKAGLTCCAASLTCETAATCGARPAPTSVDPAAPVACSADLDCADGTVCCGIDYSNREGTCRGLAACAAAQGIVVPQPDGGAADGGGDGDGGVSSVLAAQICERAYCSEAGPRSPSEQERTVCLAVVRGGGFQVTQACVDAIEATRGICSLLFRPRGEVAQDALPIFPAECRTPAPQPDADATAACATLAACGKLGTLTAEACARQVAGLGYDALSRVADATSCRFPAARFGVAVQAGAASRCRVEGDCPSGYACKATEASHGICIRSCSGDNQCGVGARCIQRHCYASCPPLEDQRREVVEAGCGGRVVLDGPPELACLPTVVGGGAVVGACVALPPLGACPLGPEPVRADGSARNAYGYTCATSTAGTVPRLGRCGRLTTGDECAASVCLPYFNDVCTDPCVASPFSPSSSCRSGEVCVPPDRGWGIVGGCLPSCAGRACPAGLTCRTSQGVQYCAP